jgi:hypothetical protein
MGGAASADPNAPTGSADWSRERFQLGAWHCSGQSGASKYAYDAIFTLEYGGSVLRARIVSKGRDGKVHVTDFNTVRPDAETYAGVWVSDDGAIGTWTNAGWDGNGFTEIGYTIKNGVLTERTEFHFTKISDTEYSYKNVRDGKATAADHCLKTGDAH